MERRLVHRLATDLTATFGRGFGRRNLFQMRAFFLAYREIVQTVSAQSMALPGAPKVQTAPALFTGRRTEVPALPLPCALCASLDRAQR